MQPHRVEKWRVLWLVLTFLLALSSCNSGDDLYDILGVKRSASQREIQKAYHRMSRLYHPDKNRNDPNANDRFSNINEAYETLSDPQKRKQYDSFGHTRDSGAAHQGFHPPGSFFFHHGGGGFAGDPFDFMFNFAGHANSGASDSMRVTRRIVENKLIPESVTRPCLILAKAHFCFQCGPISQLWNRVADELTAQGVTMVTAYLDEPGGLAEILRVTSVPAIIGITNRRFYNYASYESGREISVSSLISFLRKMLPSNLLEPVTDDTLVPTLVSPNGVPFDDGRVRVLFGYSSLSTSRVKEPVPPPLRFALAAFRNRLQAKFGCLRIDRLYSQESQNLFENFGLPRIGETISVIDENYATTGPVFSKLTNPGSRGANRELSAATIDAVVAKHGFLSLPRIFSTPMFNLVCPPESEADADTLREITLCIVLIVSKRAPTPATTEQFRAFAEKYRDESAHKIAYRIRFAYVLSGVQSVFVSALRSAASASPNMHLSRLDVAFIKQREPGQVSFDFAEEVWDFEDVEGSSTRLANQLDRYRSHRRFPYFVRVVEMLDENRESLMVRIMWKLRDWSDRLQFAVSSSDTPMFYVTLLCTLLVGIGSVVLHSVLSAVRGILSMGSSESEKTSNLPNGGPRHPQVDSHRMLNVQLFCGETCDRLIKDLPRGEMSIVLLTTRELQGGLLQSFVEAIGPYTRYHRLRFAFMDLEMPENPRWYQALLGVSLGRSIEIDWRRCAGTVLAFNGYRDYYCLFHPAYQSLSTVGRFAGLDDDEDVTTRDPKKMLQRLPQWLDCLLEGTLKRFRVEQWPNMAEVVEQLEDSASAAS